MTADAAGPSDSDSGAGTRAVGSDSVRRLADDDDSDDNDPTAPRRPRSDLGCQCVAESEAAQDHNLHGPVTPSRTRTVAQAARPAWPPLIRAAAARAETCLAPGGLGAGPAGGPGAAGVTVSDS